MKLRHLLIFLLFSVFSSAQTVVDIVVNSDNHNTLEAAVLAADLAGTLSGDGPFTLFAPTDDAFAALPEGTLDALLVDPSGVLTDILLYHTVGATALSADLSDGQVIETLNGESVTVTINMDGVFINDAQVTMEDVVADNGVVHVINTVLLPPAQIDLPISFDMINVNYSLGDFGNNFSSIVVDPTDAENMVVQTTKPDNAELWAGTTAGVDGLANPIAFTADETKMTVRVWSPTAGTPILLKVEDAADPTKSVETLTNTSVAMQWETIEFDFNNEAPGTAAINLDNTYDKVSIFFNFGTDGMTAGEQTYFWDDVEFGPRVSVVDIVVNSLNHTTLEAAVIAADLAGILSGNGPFTLFAPTDDAFAALPAGTVDALLEDPSGALTDILLYHAVGATALSTDLSDGQVIETVNGKDVTVTINMDGIFINDAQVTMEDIITDNGVVHVIDAVLLPADPTVFDIISDSPDHNTLQLLLEAASLDGALSEEGTLTVFAPTDEAFSILPQEVIDQLLSDPSGQLTDILTYHVTGSIINSTDLTDGTIGTSLSGLDYLVTSVETGGFTINANGGAGAMITVTDLPGTNGVVHVIDAIMIPTTNASIIFNSQGFSVLAQILQLTGLLDSQNSTDTRTTLFAPTDQAFLAVPEDILESLVAAPQKLIDALLYHVVEGRTFAGDLSDQLEITTVQGETAIITLNADGAFINDAQIILTDFFTGNGVIHAIDAVLLPAPTTVMDVVIRSEDHTILQIALDTANLSSTLQADGTYTVFAPTDAAFAEIPAETLNALLSEPEGQLTDILLYHVLGSEVLSTDLSDGMTATTLNGSDITVTIDDDNVFINDAQVIAADIVTENGIVHVIDVVLLPPVGTEELPSSEANVYPSPASTIMTVDFENNQFDNPTIYIVDNNGRAIRNIKNAQSGQVIDVSDYQNGMYTVVISDTQFSITKRITKID